MTSALGLLLSDVRHDYVVSNLHRSTTSSSATIDERLRGDARARPKRSCRPGLRGATNCATSTHLDLRYVGQGYELTVAIARVPLRAGDLHAIRARLRRAASRADRPLGARRGGRDRQLSRHRRRGRPARRRSPRRSPRRRRSTMRSSAIATPTSARRKPIADAALRSHQAARGRADRRAGDSAAGRFDDGRPTRVARARDRARADRDRAGVARWIRSPTKSSAAGSRGSCSRCKTASSGPATRRSSASRRTRAACSWTPTATWSASTSSCRCTSRACRQCVRNIKRPSATTSSPATPSSPTTPIWAASRTRWTWPSITPFFHDGRLTAFCGSIAHKSDLGGVVPGTGYGSAREIFQEGIQYPPVRFVARGESMRDIEAILRAN